jgi:adenine phosphoribosyltransferase
MTESRDAIARLTAAVRNVPDFPKPGIQFKDITPLLADAGLFALAIDMLAAGHQPGTIDAVVGIDARGFIFAGALALRLRSGFVPVRKKGKLPWRTFEESYELEYGSNTITMHVDALRPGARVLLIDDVLATGGTAAAAAALLKKAGADIREIAFVVELAFLQGRERLRGLPVRSLAVF